MFTLVFMFDRGCKGTVYEQCEALDGGLQKYRQVTFTEKFRHPGVPEHGA